MKRISSAAAVCMVCAVMLPAAALGEGAYSGPIFDTGAGALHFNVVKTDAGRFVKGLGFEIFVQCDEESGNLETEAKGRFRIKHGHWDATRFTGPSKISASGKVRFTGDLGNGGKADGTIKFTDRSVGLGDCTSGKRDWEAEKVPPG